MAQKNDFELEKLRYENHIKEIERKFDCEVKLEKLKHQNELERQRIKTAEIRKSIDRKNQMNFEGYRNDK